MTRSACFSEKDPDFRRRQCCREMANNVDRLWKAQPTTNKGLSTGEGACNPPSILHGFYAHPFMYGAHTFKVGSSAVRTRGRTHPQENCAPPFPLPISSIEIPSLADVHSPFSRSGRWLAVTLATEPAAWREPPFLTICVVRRPAIWFGLALERFVETTTPLPCGFGCTPTLLSLIRPECR